MPDSRYQMSFSLGDLEVSGGYTSMPWRERFLELLEEALGQPAEIVSVERLSRFEDDGPRALAPAGVAKWKVTLADDAQGQVPGRRILVVLRDTQA